MNGRKWLVRGGCYLALAGLLGVGLAWAFTTHPEVVRAAVLNNLNERFVGVNVSVGSARVRLLGGIAVHELRMARANGLESADFLYVPHALIFHDKEKLADGELGVRKVELNRPQIRIVRQRDGLVNVQGILGPTDLSQPLPTVVVKGGTIVLEDHAGPAGANGKPALEVKDVSLTLLNDPLPILQVEGTGKTDVLGPVCLHARLARADYSGTATLSLSNVPVGPDLVERLAGFCPELATHARTLAGKGSLEVRLNNVPASGSTPSSFHYEVDARLMGGSWSHARLPGTLEKLDIDLKCVDGKVPEARLAGDLRVETHPGRPPAVARVHLACKDLATQPPPAGEVQLASLFREADFRIEHLHVTNDILDRLPESLRTIKKDFSPSGPVSVTFTYRRPGPGPLVQHWLLELEGMAGRLDEFRYPVEGVEGSIDIDTGSAPERRIALDLRGKAGGAPVKIRGQVRGEKGGKEVEVEVEGTGLTLDDRVMQALPERGQKVALQFLPEESRRLGLQAAPMGKADVRAVIRRRKGQEKYHNEFTVQFRDSALLYDHFPLPLSQVTGTLLLYPDHWECKDFHGRHGEGEIFVDGRSYRLTAPGQAGAAQGGAAQAAGQGGPPPVVLPGSPQPPERVHVKIRGRNLPLDEEFEKALAPPLAPERKALQNAWAMLALTGQMNFAAEVMDNPGQPQDIDVGVDIHGCTMRPQFFPLTLDEVSGAVRYARGKVYLTQVHARHGQGELGVRSGLLQLKRGGGFQAWLSGLYAKDVAPDADFFAALPEALRKGVAPLGLHEPLRVETGLTLDAEPGPGTPLKVWWDGKAFLKGARFNAGVDVTDVTGQVWCEGYHDGQKMRALGGNLLFEKAGVLGQPLKNLSAQLEIQPDSNDILRVRNFKADLFGGSVGGQAALQLAPVLKYEVLLEALQVQLDQFGKHNLGDIGASNTTSAQAQLSGPARAALFLSGEGSDLLGLKGSGRVDVANGKMGKLPLLLDLMKAFGLRVPDGTAFEQMHLTFAIEGPQVQVQQFDLFGSAVSLRGQGTVDIDGSNLNLDFSATPGRVTWMLPHGLDAIPQAISEQILKIKMRGKLGKDGKVKLEKELVPAVTEPIKRVMGGP